ncbi:MAG: hypothetical protein QOE33_2573 [Acidobacteriota bacterium]|nr:hypothetical protein [Acidobacteriota bacterium]
MTTKKAVLIAVGLLAALALTVVLIAGSIVGFAFYTIGRSDAAQTAKTFLRQNEKLKSDIGKVRDFGYFTTGNISTRGAPGNAELRLKVVGANKSVNTTVQLATREGHDWRVVDAYYDDPSGQRIYLTQNFEGADSQGNENSTDEGDADEADDANSNESGATVEGRPSDEGGSGDEPQKFDEQSFKSNVLESKLPVLVVVGSPSSLDSNELEETMRSLAPKYEERIDLVEYDLSAQPALLQRFNVKSLPTMIIFKDGAERERRTGKLSTEELSRLLDKYLDK